MGHRDHRQRLSFLQRSTCPLWIGGGGHCETHRDPLAKRHPANLRKRARRPDPPSRGALGKSDRANLELLYPAWTNARLDFLSRKILPDQCRIGYSYSGFALEQLGLSSQPLVSQVGYRSDFE